MPRTIRFHLDENADPRIAAGLRAHGVDVTTSGEVGLLESSDVQQMAFVNAQARVVITQDADFLRMVAAGIDCAGVVFYRGRHSIGDVIRGVLLVWEVYEPDEMRNRIEFL